MLAGTRHHVDCGHDAVEAAFDEVE